MCRGHRHAHVDVCLTLGNVFPLGEAGEPYELRDPGGLGQPQQAEVVGADAVVERRIVALVGDAPLHHDPLAACGWLVLRVDVCEAQRDLREIIGLERDLNGGRPNPTSLHVPLPS